MSHVACFKERRIGRETLKIRLGQKYTGSVSCAFRFTIPHQKSLIINLSIMPAEKMSKKHQCVADGVFYAELDEVGAVFPTDSSS